MVKDFQVIGFAGIGEEMICWWRKLLPDGQHLDANTLVKTDWCRSGLSGIV